jgi:spermidine synthase
LFSQQANSFWITGPDSGIRLYQTQTAQEILEVKECAGLRWLHTPGGSVKTAMLLHEPERLMLEYVRAMTVFLLFDPNPHQLLNIGLNGGAIERFCSKHFPNSSVTTLESNSTIIDVSERYFNMNRDHHNIIAGELETFVETSPQQFDVILTNITHPEVTLYCRQLKEKLSPDGIGVFGIATQQESFLESLIQPIIKLFPNRVLYFAVPESQFAFLISFNGDTGSLQLSTLYQRASMLRSTFHFNFRHYVDLLKQCNSVQNGSLVLR